MEDKVKFVIKINDGYCEWEYGFSPDKDLSINDIAKTIEKKFKTKAIYTKLVAPIQFTNERTIS